MDAFERNSSTEALGIIERAIQLIGDEDTKLVLKILMYGITPFISVLGLTGNILSITILIRHGLENSSNILLFSLALADICFLVGFNSFPKILYVVNGDRSFLYPRPLSFFMFVLYLIFLFLDYGMGFVALTIPMLITCERFVAVYFPLRFSQMVTPQRLWLILGCLCVYWLSYIGYTCFWFEFSFEQDDKRNLSVGIIGRSALFYKDLPNITILNEIFFSMKIPPLFTLLGCVLIIVRLKLASSKRLKMTNASTEHQSNMKTNKMLLAVCFVYLFACLIIALPTYMPKEWMAYNLTSEDPSNLGIIMYQVINIVICINSSWNFTIYVRMNNKFRETFKEIIGECFKCKIGESTAKN